MQKSPERKVYVMCVCVVTWHRTDIRYVFDIVLRAMEAMESTSIADIGHTLVVDVL